MILSGFYLICFLLLLSSKEAGIRYLSVLCTLHIALENAFYFWMSKNPNYFDWSLYLTGCWFLDIALLFCCAFLLQGWKKRLTLATCIPILFSQMLCLQYPYVIPWLFGFAVESAYPSMMEMLILCSSFKDRTIKESIRTSLIIGLLVLARVYPYMIR